MMQILATMEFFVLAQETDNFRWAIILFFIISSIVSAIGNAIRKKRDKAGRADLDEGEEPVIILSDEMGQPSAAPPVARRARPPVRTPVAEESPPRTRRLAPPRTAPPSTPKAPARRRPVSRPTPAQPARKPKRDRTKRPGRRQVGTLAEHHAAIEHAEHITEHADAVGDHAEEVGTFDDHYAIDAQAQLKAGVELDVSRAGLRQAIVLNEILGPPVALRDSDESLGPW